MRDCCPDDLEISAAQAVEANFSRTLLCSVVHSAVAPLAARRIVPALFTFSGGTFTHRCEAVLLPHSVPSSIQAAREEKWVVECEKEALRRDLEHATQRCEQMQRDTRSEISPGARTGQRITFALARISRDVYCCSVFFCTGWWLLFSYSSSCAYHTPHSLLLDDLSQISPLNNTHLHHVHAHPQHPGIVGR